jgi:hypothetical protein
MEEPIMYLGTDYPLKVEGSGFQWLLAPRIESE